ncbi:transposase [Massilia sp. GER05]|uniref:transposase n=1 Tax=unclassified Massilia TaxID=2609279 RepID=UPI0039B11872
MSGKRYTEEFKIAAVKQVAERAHPASEVAERLGVSMPSLYTWMKRYGVPEEERKAVNSQAEESTIRSAGTASAMTCRRWSTKSSIFSGCRVSRKLVAIQYEEKFSPIICRFPHEDT